VCHVEFKQNLRSSLRKCLAKFVYGLACRRLCNTSVWQCRCNVTLGIHVARYSQQDWRQFTVTCNVTLGIHVARYSQQDWRQFTVTCNVTLGIHVARYSQQDCRQFTVTCNVTLGITRREILSTGLAKVYCHV
jgi:hypothetical protein